MNANADFTVIETFAKICERLNEYARELERNATFPKLSFGADIRYLESGWVLEKFVEAELDAAEGFWAAWWIELGGFRGEWRVSAHVSISHSSFFFELQDRTLGSPEELVPLLRATLELLLKALDEHAEFKQAVLELKKS